MKAKHLVYAAKIISYFGIKNPSVFDGFESYNDWKFKLLRKVYPIFI
tara:strand:+ start:595 stop:735 length:141 start_codon:yes stop_codon:yes gene_type:complete